MSFGIVYKVTNKINGKVYIGQTVQKLRRSQHKGYKCRYFIEEIN